MDYRYWYTFLYKCKNCKEFTRVGFVVVGENLNNFYLTDDNITEEDVKIAKENNFEIPNNQKCEKCNCKFDFHEIYDFYTTQLVFDKGLQQERKVKSFLIKRVNSL